MLHTIALTGGLRLLVEELPHTHSVSLGCFVGVGSGHEQRPSSGISHFIEHMLFKGTELRPTPKLISDAIEGVGGILDAYTGFESTVYYTKVADSGNRRNQAFCPECATPLFGIAPEGATGVTLRIGCLKQRAQLAPTAQIWQRSALGWVDKCMDLPGSPDQRPPTATAAPH